MGKEDFYTAAEAMEKLDLPSASFHRRVAKGEIPKVTAPGDTFSMYPKRDIDALAAAVEKIYTPEKIDFSRSTPGDQVEELEIGVLCFGAQYITPLPQRIGFQQKNGNTFWSLKVNGKVAVYGSTFHFPPKFLDDILTGRRVESSITVKQVLQFPKGEPFDIYIDVLAADPRLELHTREYYSGIFVLRFANQILDLIANDHQIRTLYTVTASKRGDNIVNKLGFQIMKGKSEKAGRIAYRFDLDEPGLAKLAELAQKDRKVL